MVSTAILSFEALVDDVFISIPAHLLWHTGALVLKVAFVTVSTVLTCAFPRALAGQSVAEGLSVLIVAAPVSTSTDAGASYTASATLCCSGHRCIEGYSQDRGESGGNPHLDELYYEMP
jgi:hypothetical protein